MKPLNKINKLIIGLSCLGALSVVSCDNEHTETLKTPALEKVSFSALAKAGSDLKFGAGDKVKVYIVEGTGTTAAKYYTGDTGATEHTFTAEGTEFTFKSSNSKIVIDGGFYLESADSPGKQYTIKKFDIIEKDATEASYVLDEEQSNSFKIITNGTNKPTVHVVSNESEVEGVDETTSSTSPTTASTEFGVTVGEVTNKLSFTAQFKKSGGGDTYYNSKTDATAVIQLTISYGGKGVFTTSNLFSEDGISGKDPGYESFKITLPMKLAYYTGDFTVTAKVTPSGRTARDFTIPNNASATIKAAGNIVMTDPGSSATKKSSSSGGGSSSTTKSTEPMMITEYVEGSGLNKYIELYNNSNSAVDLSSYTLAKDTNGDNNYNTKKVLSGTLASKTTIVYANSSAVKYTGTVDDNLGSVMTFNGNDQVVLMKGSTIIDHVGTSGSSYWCKDKGLRRKTTINKPNGTYTASEWNVITTTDDVSGLGSR